MLNFLYYENLEKFSYKQMQYIVNQIFFSNLIFGNVDAKLLVFNPIQYTEYYDG